MGEPAAVPRRVAGRPEDDEEEEEEAASSISRGT